VLLTTPELPSSCALPGAHHHYTWEKENEVGNGKKRKGMEAK
jgi:hypothetical protein